ncbi:MAG: DUF4012 domain-containing protein [Candidatus Falkowbacteria bacterium]
MFRYSRSNHPNFVKLYHQAEQFYQNLPLIKKTRRQKRLFFVLRVTAYCATALFLFLFLFAAINFLQYKLIYGQAVSGRNSLTEAIALIKIGDYKNASIKAARANADLSSAFANLQQNEDSIVVKLITPIRHEVGQVKVLVGAASMLAQSTVIATSFGQELTGLLENSKQLTYASLTKEEKRRVLARLSQSAPELAGIKANLSLAVMNLNQIDYYGVLWPFMDKITEIKKQSILAIDVLDKFAPISQVLPELSGYPNSATYLVLFQNNDELRPTGGFLGTYGIAQIDLGDITRFDTHDIYHIDMPVSEKLNIAPPEPLKQYLNKKWYMRDANWSPDWPTSARQIEWFYQTENRMLAPKDNINKFDGKFTGVIAITPKLVTDLLELSGPIIIDGQEYNSVNFVDLLQYRVEKGYVQLGVSSWQRKEVIGRILSELKIRLLNLPVEKWQTIFDTLTKNLAQKNIQMYSNNQAVYGIFNEQGWTGSMSQTTGDYLMVVDANMASLKTDRVIDRAIRYQIAEQNNELHSTVIVQYAHKGQQADWKTSKYKSYTRIYLPAGVTIKKSNGCTKPIEISSELNKTVIGCLVEVDFGQITTIGLEYDLPTNMVEAVKKGDYTLYVQRQAGNDIKDFTFDASFKNSIKSYNPVGLSVQWFYGNRINWQTDLLTDKLFTLTF